MPGRYCSGCGAKALGTAKFCAECGTSLAGGAAKGGDRQLTLVGVAALGLFLAAGLTIWTLILTPTAPAPRPGPGGGAPPGAPAASTGGPAAGLPEGHPQVVELPAEVKKFITDLTAKTKEKPQDVDAWLKLANVNSRAAQLDPSYSAAATSAFQHVLELDPRNADGLRGLANIHYDREEYRDAIPLFERYLAIRPDDESARTDLGTMYLYAGDPTRAMASYQEVLKKNPAFLQAHYNLAVAYHREGNDPAALKELETARGLATDDDARKQIDDMLAKLRGGPAEAAAPTDAAPRSPFQSAVETAFRAHPIMGARIVRFEWSAPAAGKVLVRDFPMAGMPPAVREKFTAHLAEQLRTAQQANGVEGAIRMEVADSASGTVMATVTP